MSLLMHDAGILFIGPGSAWPSSEHLPSVVPVELFQRPQNHSKNDVHHVV